jgi:hypothetical protein
MASQRISPTARAEIAANDAVARWKVLLAHNGALPTCDGLLRRHRRGDGRRPDRRRPLGGGSRARPPPPHARRRLPRLPRPAAGARAAASSLAQDLVRAGCPLVLVTRSLRWLPKSPRPSSRSSRGSRPRPTPAEVVRTPSTRPSSEVDLDNQVTLDSLRDRRRARPRASPSASPRSDPAPSSCAAPRLSARTPSLCAGIAQLVEHQLPKLRVAGSNPVSRSRT